LLQVFVDLESNKYNLAEYRVSIYGRKPDEWDKLAAWIVRFQLSSPNVRWMVQIPRLFFLYRRSGDIKSMDEMLQNIFRPLFEVTIDPSSHPDLHVFLRQLAGIDSVDDESGREAAAHIETPPHEWTKPENPPFVYWMYHLARNLSVLNQLRVSKGLDPIPFRPHAGECGDVEHLASAFLLAHCINHGLQLRKAPALQYLFYLRQIPISMSPLSNNLLFVEYSKNPFPRFFARGLQVTLSTGTV
jgi:AMP deaminase